MPRNREAGSIEPEQEIPQAEISPERQEQERELKIKGMNVISEMSEFAGHSMDSFHGSVENTKGLFINAEFDSGICLKDKFKGEIKSKISILHGLVLFTEYTPEEMGDKEPKTTWGISDIKALDGPTRTGGFGLVELSDEDRGLVWTALEKKLGPRMKAWDKFGSIGKHSDPEAKQAYEEYLKDNGIAEKEMSADV